MSPILEVKHLKKMFKNFTAVDDLNFTVEEGDFFSILGPSGCGKTTMLRMIAGFLEPTEGEIYIRGENIAGIPPNRRPVNMVFQNLALFPMMNVERNVAFGLEQRGVPKSEIKKRVNDMLERVGLAGYNAKKVTQLSGGQRQRVAIARSLVLEPSILLLDEPLGALDRKLREHMKIELKLLQKEIGTTFIYITHDQSEALVMSNKVAVMNHGDFEQIDIPQNLYKNPRTAFVAGFVGETNCFELARSGHGTLQTRSGWKLAKEDAKPGMHWLFIRPESVILLPDPQMKDLNRFHVTIKTILFDGANTKISGIVEGSGDEILIHLPQNAKFEGIREGDRLEAAVHPRDLRCYPEEGS
ncbi:ABC transporter ATP-binding protein [Nitratifractor sp.]|uniref:ABC transporter ATP-binding protein n=1 Tax=Nitratifractor sp. TaxID=2268144 RepID=UPI0025FBCE68|nr:ABC transporter ATP-binding protein [Nitratifractor sp.]